MLVLSSVICLVSFSLFLLVLGVGVKMRVCVGEYAGESGDIFVFYVQVIFVCCVLLCCCYY